MSEIKLIAIDLAKSSFHVRGVNHAGKALINRKVYRGDLVEQICKVTPKHAVIAMEACGTAHHWGRTFEGLGYKVALIAPQFVKPYVKSQKNDSADAEGIAEAASRENMRLVPVKSLEQQDIQCMHRVREQYTKSITATTNEIRGLASEYGEIMAQGKAALNKRLPELYESKLLTPRMKSLLRGLEDHLRHLEKMHAELSTQIDEIASKLDVCKRLMTIPGFGALTATALYAVAGHMNFKNGREMSAFLGLVPRQNSTGGKTKLGRISKRGDVYMRKLLVHGARSVLQNCHKRSDDYSTWAKRIRDTKGFTKGAVALANRNARIACALMSSEQEFSRDFKLPEKAAKTTGEQQVMVH